MRFGGYEVVPKTTANDDREYIYVVIMETALVFKVFQQLNYIKYQCGDYFGCPGTTNKGSYIVYILGLAEGTTRNL